MSKLRYLVLVGFLTSMVACHEASLDSPVPQYNVSCTINLATEGGTVPGDVALSVMGGWCTVNRWTTLSSNIGVCGLLVCHDIFEENRYHAYDLCCPYCYNESHKNLQTTEMCPLSDGSLGYGLLCSRCGSEFAYVLQGIPSASSGPANESNLPLRAYRAVAGGGVVYVTK